MKVNDSKLYLNFEGTAQRIGREAKGVEIILQKIWLDFLHLLCHISGQKEAANNLSEKSKHLLRVLAHLQSCNAAKKEWGDQLLVPAFNVTKASSALKSERYEKARDALFDKAHFGWHPQKKVSPMTAGLCAGVSLDYARRLMEMEKKHPFGSVEYKKEMVRLAKKYQYGVGKAGFANQIFYKTLIKPSHEMQDDSLLHLKVVVNNLVASYKEGSDLDSLLALVREHIPEVAGHLGIIDQLNETFVKQAQGERPLNPDEFINLTLAYPKAMKALTPLARLYASEIKKLQPSLGVVSLIEAFESREEAIDVLRFSHLKSEEYLKQQLDMLLEENIPSRELKKVLAEHLGLDLVEPGCQINDTKSDAENIEELAFLPDGLFETSIQSTPVRHALLIIKMGKDAYIWDPNYGLLDTQGNLQATFKKLLDAYLEKNGHTIQMRRIKAL